MAYQELVGSGLWLPTIIEGLYADNLYGTVDSALLDADEEEMQFIGRVKIDGGTLSGTKTFGTSGSGISFLTGSSNTFQAVATLTIGIKNASVVDTANGPAARATIGAAAFSVSKALVGGTDTYANVVWKDVAMNAGTPFTVTDGDLLAICFHLDIVSAAQSIKIRSGVTTSNQPLLPATTLVTSGPTYTQTNQVPNIIITFDDGTLGWLESTMPFSTVDVVTATIGNGNVNGNVFRVPFPCKIDAIAAAVKPVSSGDYAIELYSNPLGTPTLVESVAFDGNISSSISSTFLQIAKLSQARTLLANTDYAAGVKQTTATIINTNQIDVNAANHFKPYGMGSECYGAISTAGGAFAVQNSGKRRFRIHVRVSALDDGAGVIAGGGGSMQGLYIGGKQGVAG